jgi:hypothetical protein
VQHDLRAVAGHRRAAHDARPAQDLATVHDADLVRRVHPHHPQLVAQHRRAQRGHRLDQAALPAVALDDPNGGERIHSDCFSQSTNAANTRAAARRR